MTAGAVGEELTTLPSAASTCTSPGRSGASLSSAGRPAASRDTLSAACTRSVWSTPVASVEPTRT